MGQRLDDLKAAVASEGTVIESVVTLLDGISQQLSEVKDLAELPAITAELQAHRQALADAVVRNTPAAP